jgi:palmitoyltransferase
VWNCVGFRNYKYFVLFVIYTALYTSFIFVIAAGTLAAAARASIATFSFSSVPYEHIAVSFLSFVVLLGVWPLAIYHLFLVRKNKTTIDTLTRYRHLRHLDTRKKTVWRDTYPHLYDLGARRNWIQVFGPNPAMWFIPVWSSIGDGINFPAGPRALAKYNEIMLEEARHEMEQQQRAAELEREQVFQPRQAEVQDVAAEVDEDIIIVRH